jgi:hypothetical protein
MILPAELLAWSQVDRRSSAGVAAKFKIMRLVEAQMMRNAKTDRVLRDIRSNGHASIAMRGRADHELFDSSLCWEGSRER